MSGAKYSADGALSTMRPPMTEHAIEKYRERMPDSVVRPPVAWQRGEDLQHPMVLKTFHNDREITRARVYNHDDQYFVVFVCVRDRDPFSVDDDIVVTVYGLRTHEHGPTRSYIAAHGPHYTEGDDD